MTRVPPRGPLGSLLLVAAALVSWTCTREPVVRAEPAPVAPRSAGGEEEAEESDAQIVAGALADPASADAAVGAIDPEAVDEGVPGLRMPIDDPSGRALEAFHAALGRAEAGEGQARVLVWGASHVAADFTTGYLRRTLQARFGDGGHGFILPVHPWRSYRHLDAVVESNRRLWRPLRVRVGHLDVDHYGLAGVAVETDRAAAWGRVSTATSGAHGRAASRFELWYLSQPGGGDLDVFIDNVRRDRIRTRADGRAPGYASWELEDGPHTLEVRARGRGPVRLFGVTMERDAPGVVVDTLGINGARVRYQLLWEDSLYREHLARRRPDLVVLAYGTNEVGDDDEPINIYEDRLRAVVGRVRETVPGASCLLVGPTDRPAHNRELGVYEDRPRTAQLVAIQRRVAREHGCGFFDLVRFMGGPLSMVAWAGHDPPYAAPDHVHLTRAGYERLGDVLHSALLRGYGDAPEPAVDPAAPVAAAGAAQPPGAPSAAPR